MGSPFDKIAFIVLAAGLGKRMKSEKAKVLHELDGKPMILYLLDTLNNIAQNNIIVVIGHQAEEVKKVISEKHKVSYAKQEKQLGTGHAVLVATPYVNPYTENIVILCGDVPLVSCDTIQNLIRHHINTDGDMTILATNISDPKGYGRIVFKDENIVEKIVEEADADENEKKITTINTGIYCVRKEFLLDSIKKIKPVNAQGEFYFTDVIHIGFRENMKIQAISIGKDPMEYIGINSCEELVKAEKIVRNRMHKRP